MVAVQTPDWNPGTYHRFRGLRLRPALDLLRAIPALPEGDVVDLGCGSGLVGPALKTFGKPLTGIDTSPAMLEEAQARGCFDSLHRMDIADWSPQGAAPALIFCNASLHWLADHTSLIPRLASYLASGGTLAVQVPHQNNAPSHRVWVSLVEEMFPGQVDLDHGPGVLRPVEYHQLLAPLGELSLWETEYYQTLDACSDGHPVRRFTETTFARPILAALNPAQQQQLITAYEAVMDKVYPAAADGTVLFPFRRMFFTLTV